MNKPKPKSYPVHIRKQLVKYLASLGYSMQDISQVFNINGSTVQMYLHETEDLPVIKM